MQYVHYCYCYTLHLIYFMTISSFLVLYLSHDRSTSSSSHTNTLVIVRPKNGKNDSAYIYFIRRPEPLNAQMFRSWRFIIVIRFLNFSSASLRSLVTYILSFVRDVYIKTLYWNEKQLSNKKRCYRFLFLHALLHYLSLFVSPLD